MPNVGEIALTTRELSNILRISQSGLKRMRANGEIRGHKARRQLRFFLSEVLADLAIAEAEAPMRKARGEFITGRCRTKGKMIYDYEDQEEN